MRIWSFGVEDGGYAFDGSEYFSSFRAASSARAARVRAGMDAPPVDQGDAIEMLKERDAEIARLRAMVPVERWVTGGR